MKQLKKSITHSKISAKKTSENIKNNYHILFKKSQHKNKINVLENKEIQKYCLKMPIKKVKTEIFKIATKYCARNSNNIKNIWLWQNFQRRKIHEMILLRQ